MAGSLVHDGLGDGDLARLGPGLRRLYEAAVGYTTARASHAVDRLTWKLEELAQPHGAADRAALQGAKAAVTGGNPLWAAVKGAWVGADGKVKVGVVALVLLLLLVSPVLLILLLLALLVVGVIAAVRAARAGT